LTNAVKFTPQDGKVVIGAGMRADGRMAFAISDTGIGIAEADLQKVLRPFQQVSGTLNRNYDGAGLGLTITKALVELHGGELVIASELGKGTTVTAILPPERVVALPAMARS
jgi:two-component system cell cycle sensor histidine kinase PleC